MSEKTFKTNTTSMDTPSTTANNNYNQILRYLIKQNKTAPVDELEGLAMSICEDAPTKHAAAVGFSSNAESMAATVKAFGETHGTLTEDKLIEIEIVNDTTVEYPVGNTKDDDDVELFTFDKKTLSELGSKMEGIPVVIGEGHNADLPLAHFTNKFEVREVKAEDKVRTALFGYAKVRSDADAPINGEEFFKNNKWDINGGTESIRGSLKFNSKDVPFHFNDAKINYMTRPAPRHYALLDAPYILDSGVKNKNFGKQQEVIEMSEEVKTEVVADVEVETPDVVDAAEAVTEEVIAEVEETTEVAVEAEAEVEATIETEKTVPAAQYDELLARLAALETEATNARKDALFAQIVAKKHGADATEEQTGELMEAVKAFGEAELTGYLAGMGARVDAGVKSFGKGRMGDGMKTSPGLKLDLDYMKGRKN